MLHIQSLQARGLEQRTSVESGKNSKEPASEIAKVLSALAAVEQEAERKLKEVAQGAWGKVMAKAEEHIKETQKLVGESPGTKVWAHKLKKNGCSFEDLAKQAETTLLKPSYTASIKKLVGLSQQASQTLHANCESLHRSENLPLFVTHVPGKKSLFILGRN